MSKALARQLADRSGRELGAAALAALATLLDAALAEARARWPAVEVRDDHFLAALASRIADEDDVLAAVGALALADVHLVAACLAGDVAAIAAVNAAARAEAERAIAKLGAIAVGADDVLQELLLKLVVGPTPKLAGYAGHGPLAAWLRIAAIRTAISLGRNRQATPVDDDALAAIADDADDQALAFLKSSYRAEFKRAFATALAALPKRSRTLLRLQINDQLTIEEIGAFYSVSRATAARWLADARTELVARTRSELAAVLELPADELGQLMRLVASNLYATLPNLLRRTA